MTAFSVKLFQIFYKESQKPHLDPAFIPYDNSNGKSDLFEYGVILDAYQSETYKEADFVGFFSWKFTQKTTLQGSDFLEFLHNNPGYDVYFVNPFEVEPYLAKNVWYSGERFHEGILDYTQDIFNRLNYNIDLKKPVMTSNNMLFCNFWAGSTNFWEEFIAFTRPIHEYILNETKAKRNNFLHQKADKIINATVYPFIMERLFSTFLISKSDIKGLSYPLYKSNLRKAAIALLTPLKKYEILKQPDSKIISLELLRSMVKTILGFMDKLLTMTRRKSYG